MTKLKWPKLYQKKLATATKLKMAHKLNRPIITEILPVNDYNHFEEETYRQKYLLKHGQNMCH